MADDIFLTIGVETKGILTAIKTTETLKNNIEKLIKARDRNQINDAQLNASLKELAKNSGAYGKQVDGVRKSIEAANKAQKEAIAAAKQAKEEDKAFAQARREAIAINKEFDRQKKQEAAETARAAAEEERLKIKFVEGHLAMQIYSREMNDLAVAREADIITKEQQIAATARLNQEMATGTGVFANYGRGVNQTKGYTNQFGLVTQQVGYQFGDLAVQIQSGTNAFVAIGQQFTQLAGLGAQLSKSMAMIGVFTGLGIAIPIITGILAYMTRTTEETEKTVDVFQELTDATRQLYIERMKLIDPKFDENLEKPQEELKRLNDEYAATIEKANRLKEIQNNLSGPRAGPVVALDIERNKLAQEAADAAVKEAKAKLEAYQKELDLTEIERARLALQEAIARLRTEEAQAYADTVAEVNKLKDSIGQAHLEALGLAQVPMEAGINAAAEAARLLSDRLGISLDKATGLIQLTAQQNLEAMKFEFSSGGQALQRYGSRGANVGAGMPMIGPNGIPMLPSTGNGGGGGGGVASPDALEALLKRVELEKELLGTSEAYKEVMQAIKGSDKEYSDAAIQGAVARLEALNKEKEVLQQMEEQHKQIGDILESSMTSAFMSMIDGTKSVKDAFRDMARDIIKQLYEIIVVKQMVNAITGALGFANGGAFSAGRQIQAYANGGVVGGPTYFPMAGGKTGLMGEAGPEAIMPLKRGRGGKLGVSVEGASGSVNVVNNINVTGGSDPAAIRAEVAKLMPQITSATKSAVIDARRRGGQMKAAFG